VSGLRFQYDSTAPFGHKVLLDTVEVNGQPLDAGRSYSFTAAEQVYGALAVVLHVPAEIIAILPTYAFDAVRSFVDAQKTLDDRTSGRIFDVAAVRRHDKDGHGCRDHR
jgi:hypothetical protein